MRQREFERRYQDEWLLLEAWLSARHDATNSKRQTAGPAVGEGSAEAKATSLAPGELPLKYRRLCGHLALARERSYSATLIERLHRLVLKMHHRFYAASPPDQAGFWDFLRRQFPATVRREWRVFWVACALFFGTGLLLFAAVQIWPEFASVVLSEEDRAGAEQMYARGNQRLGEEDGSSRFAMFGFYVWNNVRIGFQTFAGGILLGVGSIFFLVLNGVYIGAFVGYVASVGLGEQIYSFIAGHGAPELLAIAISGAAGLKLGFALLSPGRRTRRHALVEEGRIAFRLAGGAALMFFVAAFIEAFWSPLAFPLWLKAMVGLVLWVLFIAYFLLAGSTGRETDPMHSGELPDAH